MTAHIKHNNNLLFLGFATSVFSSSLSVRAGSSTIGVGSVMTTFSGALRPSSVPVSISGGVYGGGLIPESDTSSSSSSGDNGSPSQRHSSATMEGNKPR